MLKRLLCFACYFWVITCWWYIAGRCGGVWRSTWQKRGTLSDLLAVSCPTTRSFQHVRHSNCCVSRGDHRCPRLALQSRSPPQMVRLPNYCYVPPLFIPLEDRHCALTSLPGGRWKCETGKCGTNMHGWKMQDWKMGQTTLYGTPCITYVCSVLQDATIEYV